MLLRLHYVLFTAWLSPGVLYLVSADRNKFSVLVENSLCCGQFYLVASFSLYILSHASKQFQQSANICESLYWTYDYYSSYYGDASEQANGNSCVSQRVVTLLAKCTSGYSIDILLKHKSGVNCVWDAGHFKAFWQDVTESTPSAWLQVSMLK